MVPAAAVEAPVEEMVAPAVDTVLLVAPPARVEAPAEEMVAPVPEMVPLVVPTAVEAPAENIMAPMLEKVVPVKKRCFQRRKRSYLWLRKKISVYRWFR